jgi:hypothetical protein
MRSHTDWAGWLVAASLLACLGAPATVAAEAAPVVSASAAEMPKAAAWQDVITGQVEAFRRADAVAAFKFAGAPFRRAFPDAITFMLALVAAGYGPIFTSVSHSFGKFQQMDATTVVQEVTFNGPNQEIYTAVYALTLEAGGWRIEGVQLTKEDAIAV